MLTPNLRGHAGDPGRRRAGVAEWCADIAALLDAHGCERAVVGGHCLGANVAAHFAARYPRRAAGVILIEPMPSEALVGRMAFLSTVRVLLRFLSAAAALTNGLGIRRRRLEPMDLEQWDRSMERGERPLAGFAAPLSDLRSTPTAGYLQSVCALFEPLPLGEIACPALVLLSRDSTMTDPARTRAALRRLRAAEVVEVDAEHWIPTEQPAAMRAAIEAWLTSLP